MKKDLFFIIVCCTILIAVPLVIKAQEGLPNPLRCGGQPVETIDGLISCITEALKVLVIPIATVMIIIGGIQYLTSMGNEDKVRRAKATLLYAIIGVAVVLAVDFIVDLIREVLKKT